MIKQGDLVECVEDDWFNAYGDRHEKMAKGMPARVVAVKALHGQLFLELDVFPGQLFWSAGFRKPTIN